LDVLESLNLWPPLGQYCPLSWIAFDLPFNLKPCPLKPEVKSADTREQAADRQAHSLTLRALLAWSSAASRLCTWLGSGQLSPTD
jgi:hypothetical protein